MQLLKLFRAGNITDMHHPQVSIACTWLLYKVVFDAYCYVLYLCAFIHRHYTVLCYTGTAEARQAVATRYTTKVAPLTANGIYNTVHYVLIFEFICSRWLSVSVLFIHLFVVEPCFYVYVCVDVILASGASGALSIAIGAFCDPGTHRTVHIMFNIVDF